MVVVVLAGWMMEDASAGMSDEGGMGGDGYMLIPICSPSFRRQRASRACEVSLIRDSEGDAASFGRGRGAAGRFVPRCRGMMRAEMDLSVSDHRKGMLNGMGIWANHHFCVRLVMRERYDCFS